MKKISVILTAVILSLSLCQCAKEEVSPVKPEPRRVEMKELSITAGYSTKADASALNNQISFTWKSTDSICVYGAAGYCGAVRIKDGIGTNSGYFSGEVNLADAGTSLRFIHYGSAIKPASDGSVELLLNEQVGSLGFVSDHLVAGSEVDYSGQQHITTSLTVQFAVANFKLDHSLFGSTAPTKLELAGTSYNKLSVSSVGELSFAKVGATVLKNISSSSSNYYIVVLPESSVSNFDFLNGEHGLLRKAFNRDVVANTYYYGTASGGAITGASYFRFPTVLTAVPTCISNVTDISGNLQYSVASSGGRVTDVGSSDLVQRGICWSFDENPSLDNCIDSTTNFQFPDGSYAVIKGEGNMTGFMNNLTPGKTYHVRAYATNSYGTGYGPDFEFTTNDNTPVRETVDLGTGVLWAKCNLGASSETETGNYYMWADPTAIASGDIVAPATTYYGSWDMYCTYLFHNISDDPEYYRRFGNTNRLYKYVRSYDCELRGYNNFSDELETIDCSDDAAFMTLGEGWRIPTLQQCRDLFMPTKGAYFKWDNNYNGSGVKGYIAYKAKVDSDKGKFTDSTGSPAATASYSPEEDPHVFFPVTSLILGSTTDRSTDTKFVDKCIIMSSSLSSAPYSAAYDSAFFCTIALVPKSETGSSGGTVQDLTRVQFAVPIRPVYVGSATNHGANENYGFTPFVW